MAWKLVRRKGRPTVDLVDERWHFQILGSQDDLTRLDTQSVLLVQLSKDFEWVEQL